jgi:hypothetical protein
MGSKFYNQLSRPGKSDLDKFAEALDQLPADQARELLGQRSSSPRYDLLMAKMAAADRIGREMAHDPMTKEAIAMPAGVAGGALGAFRKVVKPVGRAAINTMRQSPGTALAIGGAGVGGLAGAMKNPGVDPQTGQQKSRLKGALVGAGIGAAAGGLAGQSKAIGGFVSGKGATGLQRGMAQAEKGLVTRARAAGATNVKPLSASGAARQEAYNTAQAAKKAPAAAAGATPAGAAPTTAPAPTNINQPPPTMTQEGAVRGPGHTQPPAGTAPAQPAAPAAPAPTPEAPVATAPPQAPQAPPTVVPPEEQIPKKGLLGRLNPL